MKKLVCFVLLILCIITNASYVYAGEEDNHNGIYYFLNTEITDDESGETRKITLHNYVYSDVGVKDGWAIYSSQDLIIELIGDSSITSTNGIYTTGSLEFIGDGTLTINTAGTAYRGELISSKPYILDENDNMAYYDDSLLVGDLGTYIRYTDLEKNDEDKEVLSNLVIRAKQYADLSKIKDDVSSLYRYVSADDEYQSFHIHKGFIIDSYENIANVTYKFENNINYYYVNIFNDFAADGFAYNFIEFLFDKSEWGKTLEFEVLEVKNFYSRRKTDNPLVVGQKYSSSLIGSSLYYEDNAGSTLCAISNYLTLFAYGNDNKLVLQVMGEPTTYINVYINKKENPPTIVDDPEEYVIVNTGVR